MYPREGIMAIEQVNSGARAEMKTRPLGAGVRACQAYFAAVLLGALSYALATNPGDFVYDFSLIHGFATAALATLCVWLIQIRAREGRVFAMVSSAVCILLSAADMFLFGAFDVVSGRFGVPLTAGILAAEYVLGLVVIVCLAASPSPREALSVPLDRRPTAKTGQSFDEPLKQRVRTWPFWRDLGIYFTSFSFMGHWAEMLFCYCIYLGLVMGIYDFSEVMLWHQWLFPYFAEGVAIILIVVLLTPIKQWLIKRFDGRILPAVLVSIVITAIVCTSIDFSCGMICNLDYSVWDYRMMPFNFMGQICLQNSTIYTVAALLLLWVFYPLMDKALRSMPRFVADGIFFALVGIYLFSACLHFAYIGDAGLVVGEFVMKPE